MDKKSFTITLTDKGVDITINNSSMSWLEVIISLQTALAHVQYNLQKESNLIVNPYQNQKRQ